MARRPDGHVRAFGMSGIQIALEMTAIEKRYSIVLGHDAAQQAGRKSADYAQFESDLRAEAAVMSEFYEVFYCLENSIRKLVKDILVDAEGQNWWQSPRIDEKRIREQATFRQTKEINSGITPRSNELIDYTTFGELCNIITDNFELFEPIFKSKSAVSNVSNQLNLLRGPIAHCNPIEELEQERLNLAVRTWFRIMS